jgi:hypothetical protein
LYVGSGGGQRYRVVFGVTQSRGSRTKGEAMKKLLVILGLLTLGIVAFMLVRDRA